MKIGRYCFQPTLLASLLVLMGVVFLLQLASWQLQRATEKETILHNIELRKASVPLSLTELNLIADKNYYPLSIHGYFDNQHYLLLDNRILKSRVGFEVIQPFVSEEKVILVNRGWIPLPVSRAMLPGIPAVSGMIDVTGEVHIPHAAIVLVKDELSASHGWPQLVQSIDVKALEILYNEIDLSIEPWILRQQADDDPFYQRAWIYINMSPERHVSYAVTWFVLALALIFIYIAALTSREESNIASDSR